MPLLPTVLAEAQAHGGLIATVLAPLFAAITQLVSQGGYGGVFLAMLVENFLQFIPSEAIMPLAGYLVFAGKLQLVPTIVAGTLGTIAGTMPWYLIGRLVNEERLESRLSRHGAWFGITPAKLRKSRQWFNRYGALVVFWGRLVPILRTLISIPAGIEMMPWKPFLLWTSLGSLLWNAALTLAGFKLGENWERVHGMLRPFTALVAGGLVVLVLLFLWRNSRQPQA
jgi:membrane protein DedA with SNARE-associated domain